MSSSSTQVLTATIEIDPVRTLLVLGPQVTAICLSEANTSSIKSPVTLPGFLSFKNIVEDGIRKSLELESFPNNECKERKRLLLEHAYELEPAFAVHKVVETLKAHNSHDLWMKEQFQSAQNLHFKPESSRTLQHLLYLRRKGVRIIYTHYDDLLAKALGLPVVLPDDGEESVRKWSQGFPALLQLHGVYTKPHTIKMDCLCYKSVLGKGRVADIIREQFQSRTPIFIGYDERFTDPFLPKIVSSFATPVSMPTSLPLLLSLSRKPLMFSDVLPMAVEPSTSLSSLVKISKTPLCVAPINNSSHPVSLQLVCSSKEEVTEIFELLRHFSNILTNLAQKDNNLYVLDLQMERSVLRTLWLHILSPSIITKLQGLIAVELQGSFLVNFSPQKSPAEEAIRASPPSFPPSQALPTSLWQLPSLTHFAIPSLMQETQKQLQFLQGQSAAVAALSGRGGGGNSPQQVKYLTEKLKNHRNHSESSLSDENKEMTSSLQNDSKNGLLIHQHSAPNFPLQGTQFLLGRTPVSTKPSSFVGNSPYVTTIPGPPSFLINMDNKVIERGEESEGRRLQESGMMQLTKTDKREEFIKEAQEWSKQVGSKIKSNFKAISPELNGTSGEIPLMPLNVVRQFQVCSAPMATPTSPINSPLYQQSGTTYILASPQTNGIFNLVSSPSSLPPSSLSYVQKTIDTPTTSTSLNGMIPRLTTPTVSGDQKFMYMMQDGKVMTTPIELSAPKEGVAKRSPKRCGSPNSDPEYSRPLKQRRRSSSLPDVNQLKCSPSPSPPPSPVSPSPQDHTPLTNQSIVSFVGGTPQATPPIFFTNMSLPQSTGVKLEQIDTEISGDNLPPSPRVGVTLHPVPAGRGPIQLWQFLLDLLLSADKAHLIQWTGNGYEFHIVQPEEIAKLWGARKNKPRMNYDKLSRGLRYYYSKGIMDKVPGKKLTFKYTCDINQYILQRSNSTTPPATTTRLLVN